MELNLLVLCYLIGSITFIVGLKMLSNPASARNGNLIAAVGMLIAIVGTIFLYEENGQKLGNYASIFAALFIGTIAGTLMAKRVQMTAMPEMVSLFNGMGGACAALISVIEFRHLIHAGDPSLLNQTSLLIIMLGLIIGSVSFAGSMIAWGKLNGSIKDFAFKGQHIINIVLLLLTLLLAANNVLNRPAQLELFFYGVVVLALIYGIFFVLPIEFFYWSCRCMRWIFIRQQSDVDRWYIGRCSRYIANNPDVQGYEPLTSKCIDRVIWRQRCCRWWSSTRGHLQRSNPE
jgi:NAD(P) transhydrogenase subunit beta